jgi:hypothetical protein
MKVFLFNILKVLGKPQQLFLAVPLKALNEIRNNYLVKYF